MDQIIKPEALKIMYCSADLNLSNRHNVLYWIDTSVKQNKYWWVFIYCVSSKVHQIIRWLSWSWLYGSWIYNYLCNQYPSPLMLWVWIPFRRDVPNASLCDKVCQWPAASWWFSSVSSINKTDRHDITEILLKVALNTIANEPKTK